MFNDMNRQVYSLKYLFISMSVLSWLDYVVALFGYLEVKAKNDLINMMYFKVDIVTAHQVLTDGTFLKCGDDIAQAYIVWRNYWSVLVVLYNIQQYFNKL